MTYNLNGEGTFATEPDFKDVAFGAITDYSALINSLWLEAVPV